MTFYNLPNCDVTIEYNEKTKILIVDGLPEGVSVRRQFDGKTVSATIRWDSCKSCGAIPIEDTPNGGHKMSCHQATPRYKNSNE